MPLSAKQKIAAAKAPTRRVEVCLHTDLQDQFETLDQQLQQTVAVESTDRRLGGGQSRVLAEQIAAVRERMRDHVLVFELRAVSKRVWNRLLEQHPPRDGADADRHLGYNDDTFFDAAIRACVVAPDDLDDDDWRRLFGDDVAERARREQDGEATEDGILSARQYSDLQQAVLDLNIRKVDVPNSYAASRILRSCGAE